MKKYLIIILSYFLVATASFAQATRHFPKGNNEVYISKSPDIRAHCLQHIAPLIKNSIDKGWYPGAVVLASHKGKIIYRGVFGNRRIMPNIAAMRSDTIFDIASLTKVVVTTTAIMQLVEKGKLDLEAPVARYWPEFAANNKGAVTIRQLLTHTSGLPADVKIVNSLKDKPGAVFKAIERQRLQHSPDKAFLYSDVNFIILGYLVEKISHLKLDEYAFKNIFQPLGMLNTFYNPPTHLKNRIAPTEIIEGKLRWGQVQDDTTHQMGGVSGMAGVFSTAKDLGIFADSILNCGRIKSTNRYVLGYSAIKKMTSPQTPSFIKDVRGLGWDIHSHYASGGTLFSKQSFGHTGYTGTSIWLDPATQTWVIILTSRTHPTPSIYNALIHDRKAIADIVAGSLTHC